MNMIYNLFVFKYPTKLQSEIRNHRMIDKSINNTYIYMLSTYGTPTNNNIHI